MANAQDFGNDCEIDLETPLVTLVRSADGSLDISWDFVYTNNGLADGSFTAEFKIIREVAGRETEVFSDTVTGEANNIVPERIVGFVFGPENPIRGNYRAELRLTVACDEDFFDDVDEDVISAVTNAVSPTVTIPGANGEIGMFLIGDVNLDGDVNFSDIGPFISILSVGGFLFEADINADGAVNFLDIGPFISLLSGS